MIEALLPSVLIAGAFFAWVYPGNIMLSIGARAPDDWKDRYSNHIQNLSLNISPELVAGIRLGGFCFGMFLAVLLWISYGVLWSFLGILLAFLCFLIPEKYLERKEKKRIAELSREFPNMVTLVQVFSKAADLQKQLYRLATEMATYPMSVALNNFAKRCNYLPINNFVSVLQYGIDSGADIDDILATFSFRTYESRLNEVKRNIKSRPTVMTFISGAMALVFVLLLIVPMYSNIITKLNSF
ncbi:Uncharacterized [Syntrophomonas zehnderi OL-4]|uniref:Uncharacterized n=1 Tax=Syntrophomonas zehnderi OL-4 TaxID=690567 RepID=A0A0E4C7X7_9FIRM|nr:hypothetical protein [Syntrophomonas zehnderi]CFX15327.1 Uncharacterized [Syntrophomonas zehnderi OL-4]